MKLFPSDGSYIVKFLMFNLSPLLGPSERKFKIRQRRKAGNKQLGRCESLVLVPHQAEHDGGPVGEGPVTSWPTTSSTSGSRTGQGSSPLRVQLCQSSDWNLETCLCDRKKLRTARS